LPDPASGDGGVKHPAPGEPTTDRVKGIFANIAPAYDRINIVASFGVDRLWRRATVRAAEVERSDEVLDLAAGTGDLTLAMASQARPARVVGTDFVPEMLEIAREKAAAHHGPTEIEFRVADAQDLPFPDESFDVATVGFGVRNLPDRASNFAEAHRVLRPGGRYVILEFSRPPFAPFRWLYHVYLRGVVPLIGWMLAGDRDSYRYLNDSIRTFPVQAELAAELERVGFSQVGWRNLTGGIVALHVARKPR
jgi:demethylmenaquinone methyltransferase/2-methoxy-6-polyprenyl-1,4-benzoquinol methylase